MQAKNIVNYLRIIYRILAPGGVWINLGTILTNGYVIISAEFLSFSRRIQARSFGTLRKMQRAIPRSSLT